jgi:hypothetical protein
MAITPGPWIARSYDQGLTWKVETAEGRRAVASYIAGLQKADEANARLIAAAPDLLHACRLIAGNAPLVAAWLRENDLNALRQVEAAISKAEGK